MRRFRIVQTTWRRPAGKWPWSKTAFKEVESFTIWQGRRALVPTLEEIQKNGLPMPKERGNGWCSLELHEIYTYVLEELVPGGVWGPPETVRERRYRTEEDVLF